MTRGTRTVIGGVDTHGSTHHAAVIDKQGRELADREFPATADGERRLLRWLGRQGRVEMVGVEGTGCYGAELTRLLGEAAIRVVEVNRPDRAARRRDGKSDPLDAYTAARAALSGRAAATPKDTTGAVEAVRVLRVARSGAVKARTAAINQLHALVITAPEPLRGQLQPLSRADRIKTAAGFRITGTAAALGPLLATKIAARSIARRIGELDTEIAALDRLLADLTAAIAPATSAVFGAGPDVVGQLLVTAGENPHRLARETSLAHLCGTAPIPASSGRITRHRLNRGGDRRANSALYTIVLARMRHDPRTRAYVDKRRAQGRTTPEIMRCLKRAVVREIWRTLTTDLATT